MTVYLVLLVSVLVYGLVFLRGTTPMRKRIYLFLSFGHMALVMGLRAASVGRDASSYIEQFHRIGTSQNWMSVISSAPVYNAYNKILYMTAPYDQALLIITAAIICFSVAVFIYHFSENVVFSTFCYIALYFYFTSFNISRQFLALALLLMSVCLLSRGRNKSGWALALSAVGVHNTAFVFLPYLLLREKSCTKRKTTVWLAGTAAAEVGIAALFIPAVRLFAKLFHRYGMYLTRHAAHHVTDMGRGANILLGLFYLGVLAVALYLIYFPSDSADESKMRRLRFLTVISTVSVLSMLIMNRNLALMRVQRYFEIYIICLIPAICEQFRRMRYIFYTALLFILLLPLFYQLAHNISGVVPYQFFVQ